MIIHTHPTMSSTDLYVAILRVKSSSENPACPNNNVACRLFSMTSSKNDITAYRNMDTAARMGYIFLFTCISLSIQQNKVYLFTILGVKNNQSIGIPAFTGSECCCSYLGSIAENPITCPHLNCPIFT